MKLNQIHMLPTVNYKVLQVISGTTRCLLFDTLDVQYAVLQRTTSYKQPQISYKGFQLYFLLTI